MAELEEMEEQLLASLEEALETLQKRFSSTLHSSMPATTVSDGLMGVCASTAGSPPSDPQVSTPHITNLLPTGGARENACEDSVVGNDLVPHMDFPEFDGEDVRTWLDKCDTYFNLYDIPEYFRVTAATLHLSGQATHWFQSCKDVVGILDWDQFRQAILAEFEVSAHKDKILELLTLEQSGSVEDFRKDFESLVYHVRLFEKSLSDTFLLTLFVHGLKHELRAYVEPQFPESVAEAACLAAKHEKLLGKQSAVHLQQGMVGQAIFSRKGANNSFSQGDVWKGADNSSLPQLNSISIDEGSEGGEIISDGILNLLESSEVVSQQQLSLPWNASTGSENTKCKKCFDGAVNVVTAAGVFEIPEEFADGSTYAAATPANIIVVPSGVNSSPSTTYSMGDLDVNSSRENAAAVFLLLVDLFKDVLELAESSGAGTTLLTSDSVSTLEVGVLAVLLMNYIQREPWPPPVQSKIKSCGSEMRPIPWPSFTMSDGLDAYWEFCC